MFSTTFLGHQGWMFQTPTTAILVDPLLCESFGSIHALEYRVFPPRVWTWDQMPKIDAVVLSHEHDDHFDIPSLAKLDRSIPIHLSSRSSTAARRILETMGFTVHALVPGVAVRIGDLELVPFCGDYISTDCGEEWDTLPFLIRSTEGHGSFFSMVDIPITEAHVEWAAARAMRPGLLSWTNNALDWSHMADFLHERVEGTQQAFVNMGVGHKLVTTIWGTPAGMVMCAGGFAFEGAKAWLNDRVFCVDTEAVCENMTKLYRKEKFWSGIPGQTFHMQGGKLKSVDASAPFLTTSPRETWPSRAKRGAALHDYEPATGRRALADGELDTLRGALEAFAGLLVGTQLFHSLCSILVTECGERKPTFAFVLRDGEARHVFEYDPTACTFIAAANSNPDATYIAGLECWATDLAAVFAGQIGPIALTFARARLWNALAGRFAFAIFPALHRVSHPLRLPMAYLKIYERQWQEAQATQPVVARR